MFHWIIAFLFYGVSLVFLLFFGVVVYLLVRLLRANDFPNKRRYCTSTTQLNGKTVVVTGGYSSEIGYETSLEFARRGARVVLPYRTITSATTAKNKIIAETGNEDIVLMPCDLSDLRSVRDFCSEFLEKESNLHILVNNAMYVDMADKVQKKTAQNFDRSVGVCYVGHFLLTYLLLDVIKQSAPSRIVNVSSEANYRPKELDLKLRDEQGHLFPNIKGYPAGKLLNVLHTKYLAKLLQGSGVTCFTLHPGFIIHKSLPASKKTFAHKLMFYLFQIFKPISLTGVQGAQTQLYCALEETLGAADSGKYYDNCREKRPNKLSEDLDLARRVWDATLQLVEQ